MPEKSHPVNPRYEKRANAKLIGDVSYSIGMGRFGAELSVFRYDPTRDADLLAAFDMFVERTVAPKFKVTRCADTPDYQLPVVYR